MTVISMMDQSPHGLKENPHFEQYLKGLVFHYVSTVADVLKIALLKEKVKRPLEFSLTDVKGT